MPRRSVAAYRALFITARAPPVAPAPAPVPAPVPEPEVVASGSGEEEEPMDTGLPRLHLQRLLQWRYRSRRPPL